MCNEGGREENRREIRGGNGKKRQVPSKSHGREERINNAGRGNTGTILGKEIQGRGKG